MKRMIAVIALLAAAGCAGNPFPPAERVPLDDRDPSAMVERFRESMPGRFRQLSTIVFEFSWSKVSALGIVDVDRAQGTFTAVAMNPMGMKLFELSGDQQQVTPHFVLEAFTARGNAATAIGEDIRRIYFDLVPSREARMERGRTRITFREPAGTGTMEYVFGGAGGFMIEKRYHENGDMVWSVSYYEYRRSEGKVVPMGIVYTNVRHGYRLVVKVKEMLA